MLYVQSTHNRELVWCISPVPIPFSNPRDLLRASFPNPCGCADYPSTIVWLVVFSCAVFHLRGIRDTRAFKGSGAPYSSRNIFQNALNELRIVSKGFPKLRQAPINPELNFESTIFSNDFQPSIL